MGTTNNLSQSGDRASPSDTTVKKEGLRRITQTLPDTKRCITNFFIFCKEEVSQQNIPVNCVENNDKTMSLQQNTRTKSNLEKSGSTR